VVLGFEKEGLHLQPLHQPCFVMGFFKIRSHDLFYWGWLRTSILLISARVARIAGVRHWLLAETNDFEYYKDFLTTRLSSVPYLS
jgi:hypothetical protein